MTDQVPQSQPVDNKSNDKELNFRMLEAKYEKQLAQERAARMEAERIAQQAQARNNSSNDDEDDSEPYVDRKKLNKELARFGEQNQKQTQSDIQRAVHTALNEERKQNWIKQNADFYDTLQNHAEKLAHVDPELAEAILQMPEGFERQKLVYKNIKALGLDKPARKESTIQEKVDANRKSPFYQPSNVGTSAYSQVSDFSSTGQKNAYEQMQALKNKLRLG